MCFCFSYSFFFGLVLHAVLGFLCPRCMLIYLLLLLLLCIIITTHSLTFVAGCWRIQYNTRLLSNSLYLLISSKYFRNIHVNRQINALQCSFFLGTQFRIYVFFWNSFFLCFVASEEFIEREEKKKWWKKITIGCKNVSKVVIDKTNQLKIIYVYDLLWRSFVRILWTSWRRYQETCNLPCNNILCPFHCCISLPLNWLNIHMYVYTYTFLIVSVRALMTQIE